MCVDVYIQVHVIGQPSDDAVQWAPSIQSDKAARYAYKLPLCAQQEVPREALQVQFHALIPF